MENTSLQWEIDIKWNWLIGSSVKKMLSLLPTCAATSLVIQGIGQPESYGVCLTRYFFINLLSS